MAGSIQLPAVVTTRADVLRLYRELEALERFFAQAERSGQTAETVTMPRISKNLEAFVRQNKMNLRDAIVRKTIYEFVGFLKTSAPVVHMSFASDPPATAVVKIVAWFRREVNPTVLMQVGVQPNIAGGCTLRTTSKYFDFSLRRHFTDKRSDLGKAIRSSIEKTEVAS